MAAEIKRGEELHTTEHNEGVLALLESLPNPFDARENWPHCKSVINHVRNQGLCGSCWAHTIAGALGDHLCILSNGKFQKKLSAGDLTACNKQNSGCNGGTFGRA